MQITALLLQNLELLRFTPDFMAWITECLLVCECDSTAVEPSKEETIKVIETTKRQLIELICSYRIAEA